MYRNNKINGFKPILKPRQLASNISKECTENVDKSAEKSEYSVFRNTTRILHLFKKQCENEENIENSPNRVNEDGPSRINEDGPNKTNENDMTNVQRDSSINSYSNKIIFNVVMGKQSTRKHKKWEEDGILEVMGKSAVLKDTEGNIIHKTAVNPEVLVEGFRMFIESKEIEIIDKVIPSKSVSNESFKEIIKEPPKKKQKTYCSPYVPLGSLKKGLKSTCNPLIMPSLSAFQSWAESDAPEREEEISVDTCLANVLREHQRYGIVFLYECIMGLREPNCFGAILADEMGLGKTLQSITIIWTLLKKGPYGKPILKYVLIVTPSSLCNNWSKEFGRWLGTNKIFSYVVNAKNKPKDFKKQTKNSVMIISYDMLIKSQVEIEQIAFDLIVCDEGHRLKNNDIKVAKILNNMSCKRRILLTGTPIQNDLQEFFALIDFVNPGILGSNQEFKKYFENPIVASRCPNAPATVASLGAERASELHDKTKHFILRRTHDIINKYLPSKHEVVVFCRLSKEQEDLYSSVTDAWFNRTVSPNNNVSPLTVIMTLKKICNHPELFYQEKNEFLCSILTNINRISSKRDYRNISEAYCGKVSVVQTLMRNLKKTDEKLVLISYYTQTLDLLETICNTEELQFLRLDGSTPNNIRSKVVGKFNSNSDNSKVLLLSAKAGGVGLNLPGASRLILFDSDWNPASDSQAMARIWRDGQKKDVYILRLLTTGTIEEKIFQRQISKAGLSETIVDTNSFASLKLSINELKDLFTLTTDTDCLTHDLINCSCNGHKEIRKISEKFDHETREFQFPADTKVSQQNLTMTQLLEWEHYQQPIPDKTMQDIMLSEISSNITFLFKNSVLSNET